MLFFQYCRRARLKTFFWTVTGFVIFCILVSYQLLRQYRTEVFRLDTPTVCNIPLIDPTSKTAKILIQIQAGIEGTPKCIGSKVKFFIAYENYTLVKVQPTEKFWATVTCCYTSYYQRTRFTIINGPECFPISDSTPIPPAHRNLDIKCYDTLNKKVVYRDQLPVFRPDPGTESDQDKISTQIQNPNRFSVLILGIDSVSHQNLIRYAPKSQKFLMEDLDAVEFFGFNKIGSGTIANVIAMLSGCRVLNPLDPPYNVESHCQLVWERYNDRGFRTVHFEDAFFNENSLYPSVRRNLTGIGTHYNLTDFMVGMRWIDENEMNSSFEEGYGCYDNQFLMDVFADTILETARVFEGKPYFNYVWFAKTTHSSMSNTAYADEPLYRIMSQLRAQGALNETILIVASDHGPWQGPYLDTDAGALERVLPALYFVFPKSFRTQYSLGYEHLKLNSKRLTTQYDLYETLVDLTDLKNLDNQLVSQGRDRPHSLGQSLFIPVPLDRTCESANIPPEYCMCWSRSSISSPESNIEVEQGAAYAVIHLNFELSYFPLCSLVKLKSIRMAHWLGSRTDEENTDDLLEVTFTTDPADAEFIATLSLAPKLKLIGQVLRNNVYKGQSDCIGSWPNATYVKTMCSCL